MPKINEELQQIETFLKLQIAPQANQLDRDPEALKTVLKQMGDRSWLGLKAPLELGGTGLNEAMYRRLQVSMARTSGALTFLQTQHQSAVAKLAQSKNRILHREFFPQVVTGDRLVGVGFSHLRRQGTPMVQAWEKKSGYLLRGKVPWVTGFSIFTDFILGATLPDGRELYAVLPLQNSVQSQGGKIEVERPMELVAVTATNTVSVNLDSWWLAEDRVVAINPLGAIHTSSRRNILNHGFFALGCAYAGLDILQAVAEKKQLEFLAESWQSLSEEAAKQTERAIAASEDLQMTYRQKLRLRVKAISLAQRCSQAAVIASSGAANYLDSSAGRVYREALLFAVSGQTSDVMSASIRQLTAGKEQCYP